MGTQPWVSPPCYAAPSPTTCPPNALQRPWTLHASLQDFCFPPALNPVPPLLPTLPGHRAGHIAAWLSPARRPTRKRGREPLVEKAPMLTPSCLSAEAITHLRLRGHKHRVESPEPGVAQDRPSARPHRDLTWLNMVPLWGQGSCEALGWPRILPLARAATLPAGWDTPHSLPCSAATRGCRPARPGPGAVAYCTLFPTLRPRAPSVQLQAVSRPTPSFPSLAVDSMGGIERHCPNR